MKRLSLLSVLFLVSCGGAPEHPAAQSPAAEPAAIELDEPVVTKDEYADVLPTGAFPTIEALCTSQMNLVKPRLAEMRANAMSVESEDGAPLAPSCEISDALKDTHVSVSLPIRVLTAIDVETGGATQTFLVAMTEQGWTAVRQPFLTAFHDDPGCPSIEREDAFVSVEMKQGALVVVTTSDRGGYSEEGPTEIAMTKARACKMGGGCAPAVVVEAIVSRYDIEHERNVGESTFSTPWTLDANGDIAVAKSYDAE